MDRRAFLRTAVIGVGAAALAGSLWQRAAAGTAEVCVGPYGTLRIADVNGVALPEGFTSRVIASSGAEIGGAVWHDAPDGGACFADADGWIYVSNSEVLAGGASAIRFNADGTVNRAYRILSGTTKNCAGGATPWGTWLSCEETACGLVYETDPRGANPAVVRPAMGAFTHEAAACDPDRKTVYLTEDEKDGCFYRFTPVTWGDLSAGRLEVLCAGAVWREVPDPNPALYGTQTRAQVADALHFDGGEGCHYAAGVCYFTTKGDNSVWAYHPEPSMVEKIYYGGGSLDGVDNLTGTATGDLFVAEDKGNMEINIIAPDRSVAPFLRLTGHDKSEITGPAFSPDGTRLYFSSQRGTSGEEFGSGGVTFEVTGPFRK